MGLLTANRENIVSNTVAFGEEAAEHDYAVVIVLKNSGVEIPAVVSKEDRDQLLYQLDNGGVVRVTNKRTNSKLHIADGEIAAVIEDPK